MHDIFHNRKGFTLIELIVTVTIVGVLAAVAIPMMTANVKKAKTSEAVAALGSLRTCARLYYVENNKTWPNDIYQLVGDGKYMKEADLKGKYYEEVGCYWIDTPYIIAHPNFEGEGQDVAMDMITGEIIYDYDWGQGG